MPNLKTLDECLVYKINTSPNHKPTWHQMKVFEHTQFKEKQISRLSSYRKSDHSRNVLNKIPSHE